MPKSAINWDKHLDKMFIHKDHRKLEAFIVVVLVLILIVAVKNGTDFFGKQTLYSGNPLCKDYPVVANEVSCEESITTASARYKGDVSIVEKTEIDTFTDTGTLRKTVWLVGIKNLEMPLGSGDNIIRDIKVPVDMERPEILSPLMPYDY